MQEIEKSIAVWYQRFADNNDISLADAKKLLTSGELKELQWTVDEYIKFGKENAIDGAWIKQLENASAKVHISRLDALKLQIQQQAEIFSPPDFLGKEVTYDGSYRMKAYYQRKK